MLLLLLTALALARDNTPAVTAAEAWVGTPYRWGGRGTASNPGMDCLGILFRAYGEVDGRSWRAYPVDPSPLVQSGLLGRPVEGLAGVARESLELGQLAVGDVLYLLIAEYEIPDEPLVEDGGVRYWPWHTALYAGAGEVIHAAPGGVVRRQPLMELGFHRLYVTRP